MSLYPTYSEVKYSIPRTLTPVTKTIIQKYENENAEQRKRKMLYNKWNVNLTYTNRKKADIQKIWNFYINDAQGSYNSFHWIDYFEQEYERQYIATSDALTLTYDLPGKDIDINTLEIYSGVVPLTIAEDSTGVGDCYISQDTGADGGDQVILFTEAPLGNKLYCNFTGKLKIRCRFDEEMPSFEQFFKLLTSTGINLIGLHLDQD